MPETLLSPSNILLFGMPMTDLTVTNPLPGNARHGPLPGAGRISPNRHLEDQVVNAAAIFARIYGFSYEGTYYDLPRPTLFLVHGPGVPVTEVRGGPPNRARAPRAADVTGMAAVEFDFVDELLVWSYDKADYTIRMDVETGMFEQVLLDMVFGGGGPGISGARVSGARVSGARVSGARVSGARLSGGWSD